MSLLTRRDWNLYEQRCEKEHREWLRSLSPAEAFSLYEDFHRFAASLEADPEATARLEGRRWQEKLAARRWVVAALTQLDRASGGRRDSQDAG